jgi:hypothetical protein
MAQKDLFPDPGPTTRHHIELITLSAGQFGAHLVRLSAGPASKIPGRAVIMRKSG